MMEKMKKICQKNVVDKYTYKYVVIKDVITIVIEIIISVLLYFWVLHKYFSLRNYVIILGGLLLFTLIMQVLTIRHLKSRYICYEEEGCLLTFFTKAFFTKKTYVALSHIRYITISQDVIQKKYNLATIVVSTGVTVHEFEALNKEEAEKIKNELGELMAKNANKNK